MKLVLPHDRRIANLVATGLAGASVHHAGAKGVLELIQAQYSSYVAQVNESTRERDFRGVADAINTYRRFVKNLESEILGPKSKYYSSVMEEFPALLIKEEISKKMGELGLDGENFSLGSMECRIGSVVGPDCVETQERKCIDFCLAYGLPTDTPVPLVGFEVKKYMDKTMFGTVLETYQSLIAQRPKTVYGFIVEDEARDREVAMNSKIYGSEFVLSGQKRNKDSLCDFPFENVERLFHGLERIFSQNLEFFAEARAAREFRPRRQRP